MPTIVTGAVEDGEVGDKSPAFRAPYMIRETINQTVQAQVCDDACKCRGPNNDTGINMYTVLNM